MHWLSRRFVTVSPFTVTAPRRTFLGAVRNIGWNWVERHEFDIFRAEDPSPVTHAFSIRALRNSVET